MRPSSGLRLAAAVLLVALLFWASTSLDLPDLLDPESLRGRLEGVGAWAPLFLMVLMATSVVVSPLPSLPLDVAAGAFFGPWLGTLYSALGALLGAIVAFGIARLLGGEVIGRLVGGHIHLCRDCSDKLLTRFILVARLVPVVSFDLVSYGAGLTKISVRRFALATFVGMLPVTFVYNYFGSVVVFGRELTIALGLLMVGTFLILPPLIERYDLFSMRERFEHED